MKKKFYIKKRGFTLIELLAVIVILAVILLIVVPIVLNVIGDSRKGAFESSAMGLVKTAENACMSYALRHDPVARETLFSDGEMSGYELNFTGKPPVGGYVYINEQCEIQLAVHNNEWCAIKDYDELEVTLIPYDGECSLGTSLISNDELLDCLINNECTGVVVPDYYVGTEGSWIPVANSDELNNVRFEETNNFGVGTKWENEYLGGLDKYYAQVNDIDLSNYVGAPAPNIEIRERTPHWLDTWLINETIDFYLNIDPSILEVVDVTRSNGTSVSYSVDEELGIITILENTGERDLFVEYIVNLNTGWEPIGDWGAPFTGIFDGMNYSIDNLSIGLLDFMNVGLFGMTEYVILKNIHLQQVNIYGELYVGGLVGLSQAEGVIDSCSVAGSIIGDSEVGGLVGAVNHWGGYEFGEGPNIIINSSSSGIVQGKKEIGGLIGMLYYAAVENSYSNSEVRASSHNVGGLVGYANDVFEIRFSYATGNVVAPNATQVGGLIGLVFSSDFGESPAITEESYATGNVYGLDIVGGLIGANYSDGMEGPVKNSYARGDVWGGDGIYGVGGFVGYSCAVFTNVYATGTVEVISNDFVGGLAGQIDEVYGGMMNTSYFDNSPDNGIGYFRSSTDMLYPYNGENTYLGWDFEEIWAINPVINDGYPYLRWQEY